MIQECLLREKIKELHSTDNFCGWGWRSAPRQYNLSREEQFIVLYAFSHENDPKQFKSRTNAQDGQLIVEYSLILLCIVFIIILLAIVIAPYLEDVISSIKIALIEERETPAESEVEDPTTAMLEDPESSIDGEIPEDTKKPTGLEEILKGVGLIFCSISLIGVVGFLLIKLMRSSLL